MQLEQTLEVRLREIRSDYDGKVYMYPDVRQSYTLDLDDAEVLSQELKLSEDGLIGLELSPKTAEMLERTRGEPKGLGLLWGDEVMLPRGNSVLGFKKFAVHPETLELVPSSIGELHAHAIHNRGSSPYSEYLRLAYIKEPDSDHGVLLTRAYYNPSEQYEPWDSDLDREVQSKILTVLRLNGLPPNTEVHLAAPRHLFVSHGFK